MENMALVMGVVVATVAWQRRNEEKSKQLQLKRQMKRRRKKWR